MELLLALSNFDLPTLPCFLILHYFGPRFALEGAAHVIGLTVLVLTKTFPASLLGLRVLAVFLLIVAEADLNTIEASVFEEGSNV